MEGFSLSKLLEVILAIGVPAIVGVLVWIGRKLEKLDSIDRDVKRVKRNLKLVCDTLISNATVDFDHTKLESLSPLQLKEDGKTFVSDLGFDEIFEENKEDFFEFVESEEPKTDYDIEIASQKSILVLFEEDYFDGIKEFLYNNPKVKKHHVTTILGVYVRDRYQEEKKRK